jgi:hypothetical protein
MLPQARNEGNVCAARFAKGKYLLAGLCIHQFSDQWRAVITVVQNGRMHEQVM